MATATRLSDIDVAILRQATLEYHLKFSAHPQEAQRAVADRAWRRVPKQLQGRISDDELVSIGSKLESFGLVTKIELDSHGNHRYSAPWTRGSGLWITLGTLARRSGSKNLVEPR